MNYEEIICDANNLYRAYKVSVKTSKWKETTQKFMMNFLRYIFSVLIESGLPELVPTEYGGTAKA